MKTYQVLKSPEKNGNANHAKQFLKILDMVTIQKRQHRTLTKDQPENGQPAGVAQVTHRPIAKSVSAKQLLPLHTTESPQPKGTKSAQKNSDNPGSKQARVAEANESRSQ